MKIWVSVTAILLFSSLSFAERALICVGQFREGPISTMVELSPSSNLSQDRLAGTLPTSLGAIDFEVRKTSHGYYYRAQGQDPAYLYISEEVLSLPAARRAKLSRNREIILDCRPYSLTEYCRIHTC